MKNFKKILAIGAHYDDLELGCGGTLAKLIKNGSKVTVVIITDSEIKDEKNRIIRSKKTAKLEGKNGLNALGLKNIISLNYKIFNLKKNSKKILNQLNKICEKNKFDTIFTHWIDDAHIDHHEIAKLSIWISRKIDNVFHYRSNYYKSNKEFIENYYFDISNVLKKKEEALMEHKSEMKRTNFKWFNFFINKCKNDGIKIGTKAAEVFYSSKIISK